MDGKFARRSERIGGTTCVFWLAGRCNRNPCRFLHTETPSPHTTASVNANTSYTHSSSETTPTCNPNATLVAKNRVRGGDTTVSKASKNKSSPTICKYWTINNCVHGEQCLNLHSWFHGDGLCTVTKLQEHKKVITGITLPVGSDKLYSGSSDGTIRIWDCHTGLCANVINLGAEVTSLISEGTWIFVGLNNSVKAWNTQAISEYTLDGPKGRVLAMTVGNDTLFAASEDGVITAWRGRSEAESPFEVVASLSGHTKAVVCLTVGRKMLYSGSMDQTIKVWNMDTLQCSMTLNEHTDVVTSLICWDEYLLSSSSDCTVKIWACKEVGTLNVRGHLFAKKEVSSIESGPSGLFFTGDGTVYLINLKTFGLPLFLFPLAPGEQASRCSMVVVLLLPLPSLTSHHHSPPPFLLPQALKTQ
ncbi:unnamed protein product [Sphenostylis stenocarpa]|uniref:C3H1-type domain-containing protein n=1 Tax=Sphenostylis stenocarpa TaxID=92480 RepID=A0AA86VP47_9FABA|nr:unnamed protein product [Sphenostylis stenocarpa]